MVFTGHAAELVGAHGITVFVSITHDDEAGFAAAVAQADGAGAGGGSGASSATPHLDNAATA